MALVGGPWGCTERRMDLAVRGTWIHKVSIPTHPDACILIDPENLQGPQLQPSWGVGMDRAQGTGSPFPALLEALWTVSRPHLSHAMALLYFNTPQMLRILDFLQDSLDRFIQLS